MSNISTSAFINKHMVSNILIWYILYFNCLLVLYYAASKRYQQTWNDYIYRQAYMCFNRCYTFTYNNSNLDCRYTKCVYILSSKNTCIFGRLLYRYIEGNHGYVSLLVYCTHNQSSHCVHIDHGTLLGCIQYSYNLWQIKILIKYNLYFNWYI